MGSAGPGPWLPALGFIFYASTMAVGMLTSPPRASFLPHCPDHSTDPNQSPSSVEGHLTPDHHLVLLSGTAQGTGAGGGQG